MIPMPVSSLQPLVMVADDDEFTQAIITRFLRNAGYDVCVAANGEEVLRLYYDKKPELVLMDAQMPVMDGFEACNAIRGQDNGHFAPIIMVTSLDDDPSVEKAFAAGAEEYITKPIHWAVLRQRIGLLLKSRQAELERRHHLQKLLFERAFIEEIIIKMRASERFDPEHLRYIQAPVEATAGDMLLADFRPDGSQHVLLGDFTGHGLPAALGGPLVADIFYTMTGKGCVPQKIIRKINQKLYEKTPTGMFLALAFLELDGLRTRLIVWNQSLPDVLVFRGGEVAHRISSNDLACGILPRLDSGAVEVPLEKWDRIYAYTDGVVEQTGTDGQMFGQRNLEKKLAQILHTHEPLDALSTALHVFRQERGQADDITMVEITC